MPSHARFGSLFTTLLGLALGGCGSSQPSATSPTSSADPAPADIASPVSTSSSAAAAASASSAPAAASEAARPERTANDLQAVILANRERFRACYDEALKTQPRLEGKFVLRFVVHPNGTLKSVATDPTTSQIHDESLASCAFGVLKTLKFPVSHKGMESTVTYPFDFHPKPSQRL